MDVVARRLTPGGVILFDDAMHPGHREEMIRVSERHRLDFFFLQDWTMDHYGRFAALAVKPE